jgi:peptide/nickel transport system substrate-binding protein
MVAAVVAVVAFAVAGCGGGGGSGTGGPGGGGSTSDAAPGGKLTIGQLGEAPTLAPAEIVESASVEVSTQINEPLYKQNEAGKIVPLLATGYKRSKDGLTWTVGVRKGVKFSDGKPMSADDVVFSLEAARKSPIWAGLWEEVESVKALSPSSVQIKTKKPMAALLSDLSSYSAAIVPDHYGGMTEKEFAQDPIGTGPFELKSWAHGRSLTLVKNAHYWQSGQPSVDEIVFTTVPDDSSRVAQMKSGALDIIGQPEFAQFDAFESTPGFSINEYGMFRVDVMSLNLKKPVFQNHLVREAINLAIDREGVVSAALFGHGEPANSFLPPTIEYADAAIKAPAQDLEKAKALLAEAVKEGVDPSFTLTTIAGMAYGQIAGQIIQQNLDEVGFNVTLQALDNATVTEQWLGGEATAVLSGYYGAIPDPSELSGFYLSAIAAPNGVETKSLEAIAADAATELDSTRRAALYSELQEKVGAELQQINIDFQPAVWVTQDQVTGLEVNSINTPWLNRTGFTE